jgi:serine protease AprX
VPSQGKSWAFRRTATTATTLSLALLAAGAAVPSTALAAPANGGGLATSVPMSAAPSGPYNPATDMGSTYNISQIVNARAAWKAGYTGKGVDVAVIDSGVSPVAGLDNGNVVDGPDLSFDSQDPLRAHLDGYGHGTHMAGLIVGRDAASTPSGYASGSASQFTGIAPDARVVDVKAGAFDGSVDVSQVIAGINWVTQHAHDPGFNIRVISLSYGTDSTQPSQVDPLAFAVEQAWKAGIVVVVAGGNDGTPAQVLANPGYDPYVLAVGADDPQGTVAYANDTVPDFTSRGTNDRHVDLVAPGAHVAGLRVPGSVVDDENPGAVIGGRFLRGSGTSQATAIVAGAAADLLQKYPSMKPDQVKRQLMATAHAFTGATNVYRGNGVIDVAGAINTASNTSTQSLMFYGYGTGSLEAARGSAHVSDGVTDLTGEQDIFGSAWSGSSWAALAARYSSWSGGTWNGRTWSGNGWNGRTWSDAVWDGRTWSGRTWSDSSWAGKTWDGRTWSGSTWDGRTWSGRTWSGRTWSDAVWG